MMSFDFVIEVLDESGRLAGLVQCTMVAEDESAACEDEAAACEREAAMAVVSFLPPDYLLMKLHQMSRRGFLPSVRSLVKFFLWCHARMSAMAAMGHWVAVRQIAQNLIATLIARIRRWRLLGGAFAGIFRKEVQR